VSEVDEREKYLYRSSTVLQALGVIGYDLYTRVDDSRERGEMLAKLSALDWSRSNLGWQDVIGSVTDVKDKQGNVVGRQVSQRANRQSIDATIKMLRDYLGITQLIKRGLEGAGTTEVVH